MQLINAINKKDTRLSTAQEENQTQMYSWAFLSCIWNCFKSSFVHFLDCSQKCLSQAVIIHGFTMDMEVTIRIKKLKPLNFSFTISCKYETKKGLYFCQ